MTVKDKVWVILDGDWIGWRYVVGVFTSEKKAYDYYNKRGQCWDEPVEVELDLEEY